MNERVKQLGDVAKQIKEWLEENPEYLKRLKANLQGIKKFCMDFKQDWVFVTSGYEGSGKSTITLQEALLLNEKFRPRKHGAWNIKQFILKSMEYRRQPGTCIFLDEAARMFLSKETAQKHNIILVKIFISNRSFQHFYFLNIPNFFWLERYIREFRIRSLTYTFFDYVDPHHRMFAYYSKKKYLRILLDSKRARLLIIDADRFVKKYKPNFVEEFFAIPEDSQFWKEYMEEKEKFQVDLLEEALKDVEKWEEKKKIGFHEKTDLKEFLKFLASRYRLYGTTWMKFTIEGVARDTFTRTENIQNLVDALRLEGYIQKIGRGKWQLTSKGLEIVKEYPGVVPKDLGRGF